jgi:hypothetical protein
MSKKPRSFGTTTTTATATPAPSTPACDREVSLDDFVAYLPTHVYIFTPCRETWTAAGVDGRLPPVLVLDAHGQPKRRNNKLVTIRASRWLDLNHPTEQMAWVPGQPMLIKDRLVVAGGWIERKGVTCFNLYRPPSIKPGDKGLAQPWLDHVRKVFERVDADHIVSWLAHRVQRPGEKINHGLVLGGNQGIGKDSMLEPVKHAVAPWNFIETSPTNLLARFTPFAKSVILRVNEGRDLGEIDRFKFYDRTKVYTAAPPDVLRVDEKHLREYYVFNVLGFILTTNHKTDGIYLPANDRRHYVAWSDRKKEDFTSEYWNKLWRWYEHEDGFAHVAAYLATVDLSGFNPKAPPPKTAAFWEIVSVNQAPEDAELADVLDRLGTPKAVTVAQLIEVAAASNGATAEWLLDRRNRRALPHRLERCGYISIRNPYADDGLWRLNDRRQVIYAQCELSPQDRLKAAEQLRQ